MISPRLTDVARARLDSISFFLAIYVLCAVLFRWVWNVLARDFAWMPRLTFKKSLAVLVVAGLFMYFILTMISGARELLTPGAWARNGTRARRGGEDDSNACGALQGKAYDGELHR